MAIKIVNMRGNNQPRKPWQIRVDRKSVLGNPYRLHRLCDRDKSCNKYDARFQVAVDPYWYKNEMVYDLTHSLVVAIRKKLNHLLTIHQCYGKLELFCWCAPLRCHSETIKHWLEAEKGRDGAVKIAGL